MYPQNIIHSVLDEHAKTFVPHTADCEYQSDFRIKDKDEQLGVATEYCPTQDKNHIRNRKLEKDG